MQSNPSGGGGGSKPSSGDEMYSSTGVGLGNPNNGHNKKRARGESPSSSMMSSRINQPTHHHHHHHHSHHGFNKDSTSLNSTPAESKFYSFSTIDSRDPLEQTLEEAYTKLQNVIVTETSASFNELVQFANQSKMHQDDVANALLYSILTDPSMAQKCLRNLFLVCGSGTDQMMSSSSSSSSGLALIVNNLLNIILENYFKLLDQPRQQLIWLLRELVKARVGQFDKLLLQMMRNIQSGSLADKNIWLAESMLDILYDQSTTTSGSSKINF